MGDSAQPVPSMPSPIPASPTDSECSSDEAMMLMSAQFSAPDECSSSQFQLYRLPWPPASLPTDLLSFWLSKYISASFDAAPAEPTVEDVLAFVNTDLDDTDLGVWNATSVVIPNTPEPTLSWFVETPSWPAPGVVLSPCSPPASKCPEGALNSPSSTSTMPALRSSATQIPVPECGASNSPSSTSTMPASKMPSTGTAGALNSPSSTSTMPALPSSATQIPVPECGEGIGEGIVLTPPPARRELFLPDSATASTEDNLYSSNQGNICTTYTFGLPGHQFKSATQDLATLLETHANPVPALVGRIFGRHQSVPISSRSADPSGQQQTMIPRRRLSWEESWQQLPPVVVVAAPMPVPQPPLLSSLGSPPSWSPSAPEPQAQLSFETGESSTSSSKSAKLGVKELIPKRVTRSATLKGNKDEKASFGIVANSKLRNAQQSRKRFNESLKTLQKLVTGDRKVDLVTLLEMTCNSIIMMEYQIERNLVAAKPI